MQLTLHTLESISKPSIAVIGLHGWTGDEYAMESVAKLLKLKHVKWFFPRAPYKAPSSKGFTWFEGSDDKGWNYAIYCVRNAKKTLGAYLNERSRESRSGCRIHPTTCLALF